MAPIRREAVEDGEGIGELGREEVTRGRVGTYYLLHKLGGLLNTALGKERCEPRTV